MNVCWSISDLGLIKYFLQDFAKQKLRNFAGKKGGSLKRLIYEC